MCTANIYIVVYVYSQVDLRRINWPPNCYKYGVFCNLFFNGSPNYFEILSKLICIICLHIAVTR